MQRLIYAQNVSPPLKGHTHTHTSRTPNSYYFLLPTDVVHKGGIGGPLKLFSLIALACVCMCFAPRDCIHQVQSNTVEEFLTPFYNRPKIVSPPIYIGYSCAGGVIFPLYIYASGRSHLSSKGKENINTKKRRLFLCALKGSLALKVGQDFFKGGKHHPAPIINSPQGLCFLL